MDLQRSQIELGQFLHEQLQDQATALLNLGDDLVARPSREMVAALACSWLVKNLKWKQAVIVGKKEKDLVVYAAYPPLKPEELENILKQKPVLEGAHEGKISQSEDVTVLPLRTNSGLGGCLLAEKAEGDLKDVVGEIARALELAATLAELGVESQKLREVDAIRNSFIAITSHQLRTPLSIVKWMFSVFLTDPELTKMDKQMQMIKQAYSGVERIIDVVNDLLNVSRIQDGKLPYSPSIGNPRAIIADVLTELKPIADSRSVTLTTHIAETLPEFSFDPILLREALHNLINNAIDYNQEKGSIEVTASAQGGVFELVVSNTGPGIKPEDKENIFTPLFRGQEAVLLRPDGSGLGLYLAKSIAEAHKGSLEFESIPGKITTFTMSIPLKS